MTFTGPQETYGIAINSRVELTPLQLLEKEMAKVGLAAKNMGSVLKQTQRQSAAWAAKQNAISRGALMPAKSVAEFKQRMSVIRREFGNYERDFKRGTASMSRLNTLEWRKMQAGVQTALIRMTAAERAFLKNSMVLGHLSNLTKQWISFGKNTQWLGRQLMVGLTLPIVAFGAAAVRSFESLDKGMARFAKITGQERSSAAVEQIKDDAKVIGNTYGVMTSNVVAQFADLAAQGLSATETLKRGLHEGKTEIGAMAEEINRISVLGNIDTVVATDFSRVVRAVFTNAGDLEQQMEDLNHTMNIFNAIENVTALQLADLAEALPEVAQSARMFGLNAAETTAIIAGMYEKGFTATEAAHSLKFAFQRIQDPTTKAAETFKENGIALEEIKKQSGDSIEFFHNLSIAMSRFDKESQSKLLGRLVGNRQANRFRAFLESLDIEPSFLKNAGKALNDVLIKGGTTWEKANEKVQEDLKNQAGLTRKLTDTEKALIIAYQDADAIARKRKLGVDAKAVEQLDIVLSSPTKKLDILRAKFRDFMTGLGEFLIPMVIEGFEKFIALLDKLNNLGPIWKKLIAGGVAALAALGPVIFIMGQFVLSASAVAHAAFRAGEGMLFLFGGMRRIPADMIPDIDGITEGIHRFGGSVFGTRKAIKNLGDVGKESADELVDSIAGIKHQIKNLELVYDADSGHYISAETAKQKANELATAASVQGSAKVVAANEAEVASIQSVIAAEVQRAQIREGTAATTLLPGQQKVRSTEALDDLAAQIRSGQTEVPIPVDFYDRNGKRLSKEAMRTRLSSLIDAGHIPDVPYRIVEVGEDGLPLKAGAIEARMAKRIREAEKASKYLAKPLPGSRAGLRKTFKDMEDEAEQLKKRVARSRPGSAIIGLGGRGVTSKVVEEAVDVGESAGSAFSGGFSKWKTRFSWKGLFTGIKGGITQAIEGSKGSVSGGFTKLFSKLGRIPGLSALSRAVAGPLRAIGPMFASAIPAVQGFAGSLSGVGAGLLGMLGPVALVIAAIAGIVVAVAALSGHWDDFTSGFKVMWDKAVGHFKDAWESLKEAFGEIWNAIKEIGKAFQPIIDAVKDLFGAGEKGKKAGTSAAEGWKSAGATIGGVVNVIAIIVKTMAKAIAIFAKAFSFIVGILAKIVNWIFKTFSSIGDFVKSLVGFFVNLFQGNFVEAFKHAANAIIAILNLLVQAVAKAIGSVVRFIGNAIGWLSNIPGLGGLDDTAEDVRNLADDISGLKIPSIDTKDINIGLGEAADKSGEVNDNTKETDKNQRKANKGFKEGADHLKDGADEADKLRDAMQKVADATRHWLDTFKSTVDETMDAVKELATKAFDKHMAEIDRIFDESLDKLNKNFDDFVEHMKDPKKKFNEKDPFFASFANSHKKLMENISKQSAAVQITKKKIQQLEDLQKAQERQFATEEYLERRREMLRERELSRLNYTRNRALAIYEGRIDDARALDLEQQKAEHDFNKDFSDLETDRQRELMRQRQEDQMEQYERQLEIQEAALDKSLEKLRDFWEDAIDLEKRKHDEQMEIAREAFENQLDLITEFTPKTIAEYKAQLDGINQLLKFFGAKDGVFVNTWQIAQENMLGAVRHTAQRIQDELSWEKAEVLKWLEPLVAAFHQVFDIDLMNMVANLGSSVGGAIGSLGGSITVGGGDGGDGGGSGGGPNLLAQNSKAIWDQWIAWVRELIAMDRYKLNEPVWRPIADLLNATPKFIDKVNILKFLDLIDIRATPTGIPYMDKTGTQVKLLVKKIIVPPLTSHHIGGMVGPDNRGLKRNETLAKLEVGEFVMQRRAVNRYGVNLMKAINSGTFKIPKFSAPVFKAPEVGGVQNKTEHVTYIIVDNFIGEEAWFEELMKKYNIKIVKPKQRASGAINRTISSYKDNNVRYTV